jgi:hypothetical protein
MKEKGGQRGRKRDRGPSVLLPAAVGRKKSQREGPPVGWKMERRWGCCLGSSPDFQPKKRDQKMVLDPGSGSSALWAQGSRKDIKSPPSLIVKLPPLGNSV